MENRKRFRVSLDMKAPTAQRNEWEVVEGDNGNVIEITLTDGGEPVDLTGCRVLAVFGLPTGATVEQDTDEGSVTVGGEDNNVITIALATGSFSPGKSSSGLMKCEIQVYSGARQDVLITSAQFTFRCRRAIMNDQTIEATDEYPILVELIREVQGLILGSQSDWDEDDPAEVAYIRNKPARMDPAAHASSHAAGGADEVTPASIGAAAALHAASHAAGGADEVTPAAIGAATDDHAHGNITAGGALQETDVPVAAGDRLLIADASDGGKAARSDLAFTAGDTVRFLSAGGAFRAPPQVAAASVSNLNEAAHSADGAVRFYSFAGDAANAPGYAGFCVFFSYAYPRGVQYAFDVGSARISRRGRATNGTWGSWTEA